MKKLGLALILLGTLSLTLGACGKKKTKPSLDTEAAAFKAFDQHKADYAKCKAIIKAGAGLKGYKANMANTRRYTKCRNDHITKVAEASGVDLKGNISKRLKLTKWFEKWYMKQK